MSHKILLVNEDSAELEVLRSVLLAAGFQVIRSATGLAALAKARRGRPSLVICDAGGSQITGLKLCRLLKTGASTRDIPIILLSSQANDENRIEGLELGADDFIGKPYHMQELILRVRRSLQRAEDKFGQRQKIIVGELALDSVRHEVTVQKRAVTLTMIEFKLLELFMENHGTVLDREALLEEVWGNTIITRALDQQVSRLRDKLGVLGACIETVQGIGYRLNKAPVSLFRPGNYRQTKAKLNWPSDRFKQNKLPLALQKDLTTY